MNTVVNITGLELKCLEASDKKAIKNAKQKEADKRWYLKNKKKKKELSKQWYLKNKEKRKQYILNNKEKRKNLMKQWYLKNKEKVKEFHKKWYLENKERVKKISDEWYLKNKERVKEKRKQWCLKNKEYIRERDKKRRKNDSTYRLLKNLRRRTSLALKGKDKSANTMALLGVTNIELVWKRLESTFKPGMTRENHGKWHVDHIRPCASFDLSNPEEQIKCFHYTNLQALWAHENISKGAKIMSPDAPV